MIDLVITENILESISPTEHSICIHTTQYADDTIILCQASKTQLNKIKFILYLFKLLLGLKININKSTLVGPNLQHQQTLGCAALLGYKILKLPIQYLKIPLHQKALLVSYSNFVVNKVERKLASWKKQSLSLTSRLILVNSILRAIPDYWMSVYQLPSLTITKIDGMCSHFE